MLHKLIRLLWMLAHITVGFRSPRVPQYTSYKLENQEVSGIIQSKDIGTREANSVIPCPTSKTSEPVWGLGADYCCMFQSPKT